MPWAAVIHIDVSALLPLRDAEESVATLVDNAAAVHAEVVLRQGSRSDRLTLEILALDERSGDNTASMLSVLHGKHPALRSLQDLDPGTALRSAARLARGEIWLVIDRPIAVELGAWAVGQVIAGQRAAFVPGHVLAIHRSVGVDVLRELDGGLAVAQREVERHLRRLGETPARCPAPTATTVDRAVVFLRGQSGRFGLGFLDRPLPTLRQGASILRNRLL